MTATALDAEPGWAEPRLRHKRLTRRMRRDLRVLAPLLGLFATVLLLASVIATLEDGRPPALPAVSSAMGSGPLPDPVFRHRSGHSGQLARISSSSTSNTSAAPPGMLGGFPRSP